MTVVHENKFAQAYYDERYKIIWHLYIDAINPGLLKTCHRADMQFVKTHNVVGCLYDLTAMKGNFIKVLNFIIGEYEPSLSKHNVKFGSFALNRKDVFMKFALNQMFDLMGTSMELMAHRELKAATEWLGSKVGARIVVPEFPRSEFREIVAAQAQA
jgi:hypothetical protein